ncbi:MAG: hypothetical protein V3U02_12600 [Calditrichia bacterium]
MLVGAYDLKNENLEAISVDEPLGLEGLGIAIDEPLGLEGGGLGRRWRPWTRARRFLRRRPRRLMRRIARPILARGKGGARRMFLKRFKRRHPTAWRAAAAQVQHLRRMRGKRAISGLSGLNGPVENLEAELGIEGLGGLWDDITGAIKRTAGKFIKGAGERASLALGFKQAEAGRPPAAMMRPAAAPPDYMAPPTPAFDIKAMLPVIGGAAALIFVMMRKKKR